MEAITIYYSKPENTREAWLGTLAIDAKNVDATHTKVGEFFVTDEDLMDLNTQQMLGKAWTQFQAENWSPNGEARELIRELGLAHTSMSVGDVLVFEGRVYAVAGIGFNFVGKAA